MKYRIVAKSNYDREDFNEYWVQGPAMPLSDALRITEIMNKQDPHGEIYYRPEPLDYKLYKFEP